MPRRFTIAPYTGGFASQGHPYRVLHDMRRDIDDMFNRRFADDETGQSNAAGGTRNFLPVLDIDRVDDQYVLSVEVPGIDPADIEIDIEDGILTIAGEKSEEREAEDGSRRERSYGRFRRSIQLADDVDQDKIEASSEHGVLMITLPKRAIPEQERKRIKVRSPKTSAAKKRSTNEDGTGQTSKKTKT